MDLYQRLQGNEVFSLLVIQLPGTVEAVWVSSCSSVPQIADELHVHMIKDREGDEQNKLFLPPTNSTIGKLPGKRLV